MALKKTMGQDMNNDLKSELIRALFVLRDFQFHRLGGRKSGVEGMMKQDMMECDLELNISAFALLHQLQLREEKGGIGGALLSEMQEYLHVSKAAVSQMLGSLENRGLITRETDPENRRTIIVRLTEKGNETIENVKRGFDSFIGMLIDRFGEKDTSEIIRLIYKFADIVKEVQDDTGAGADQ